MKVLAVLTLAVIAAVSLAHESIGEDNPAEQLEELIKAFWSFLSQPLQTPDEQTQSEQDTDVTPTIKPVDLSAKITLDLETVQEQLTPFTEHLMNQIQQRMEEFGEAMNQYLQSPESQLGLIGNVDQYFHELQNQQDNF